MILRGFHFLVISSRGQLMGTIGKLMVWDSNRATPKNPNPFHEGIPNIQTTKPNH